MCINKDMTLNLFTVLFFYLLTRDDKKFSGYWGSHLYKCATHTNS